MRIRCWGARGSIPVSGPEYLRYGGDTTCLELWNRSGDVIVVDAGSGIRRLGKQLLTEETRRVRMLFTHAHWDHLLGFPFFGPLYRDSWRIEVFGCPCAQSSIQEMISQTMSPPNFPVPLEDVHAEVVFHADCEETFSVGGLSITPPSMMSDGRRPPMIRCDAGLSAKPGITPPGRGCLRESENE